jgi:hypothetical protein
MIRNSILTPFQSASFQVRADEDVVPELLATSHLRESVIEKRTNSVRTEFERPKYLEQSLPGEVGTFTLKITSPLRISA